MIGSFGYYAPTRILFGSDCVKQNREILTRYGKKAFLITYPIPGRHAALEDVKEVLDQAGIGYLIETGIEENPSTETVWSVCQKGRDAGVDFLIGIGGGSPIDAAKAIGVLLANPDKTTDDLFTGEPLKSLPLLAIPTTAGTGAEVAKWSVLTRNDLHTKQAIKPEVYAEYALIDPTYLMGMPERLTRATAIDALCHSIESYLSTVSSFFSRALCETAFRLFSECVEAMNAGEYPYEVREKQMLISVYGGLANSQTGSGLPHGMSYPLTHHHRIPHGLACGLLIGAYLESFQLPENREKIDRIVSLCGFSSLAAFSDFVKSLLSLDVSIPQDVLEEYAQDFSSQKHRFARHPEPAGYDEILAIYQKSLR